MEEGSESGMQQPLFRELTADEKDMEATVIESLCMECERNVSTSTPSCLLF